MTNAEEATDMELVMGMEFDTQVSHREREMLLYFSLMNIHFLRSVVFETSHNSYRNTKK